MYLDPFATDEENRERNRAGDRRYRQSEINRTMKVKFPVTMILVYLLSVPIRNVLIEFIFCAKVIGNVFLNVVINTWFFITKRFDKDIIGVPGTCGANGQPGKSAYDDWLDLGHKGDAEDFLKWLQSSVVLDANMYMKKPTRERDEKGRFK